MRTVMTVWLLILVPAYAAEDVVPVHQEPMHRLLFDSGNARVLELYIPSGATTLFHTHSSPIFYITISTSALRMQRGGGEWQEQQLRSSAPGDVRFNDSYKTEPVTHRVNNVGDDLVHSILILNENGVPAADDDTLLPGSVGIDSDWFRQSRIELAGGESIDWPGGSSAVFFVLASDTHVTLTGPGGRQKFGMTWTGGVTPVPPGFPVRIANHSDETATLIAVAPL